MKKILMIVITIAIAMMSTNVEAKKKKVEKQNSPFGDVFEVPAAEHDTDEYFGATGIAYGDRAKMDEIQLNALRNAQNMIRQKMKHSYKGLITDYSKTVSTKKGNDIQSKAERGGEQIIDVIVNDTQASSGPFFSAVDEKGNVTCYIGIRVSKRELADKISDLIAEDEEMKLLFNEEQFRKRMDATFKKYKEEQQ